MVRILCRYVCKWENVNYSTNGRREVKENDGGGKFDCGVFDVL
jgi:hypothetical protein